MGLKPWEVKKLNLRDFNLMLTGYLASQNREWDRTRHMMSYIVSFSGMGTKDFITPESVMPLPQDLEGVKRMIRNIKQAEELVKEFEIAINAKIRS